MEYDSGDARVLLGRTPSTLAAMLEGLPDAWLDAPERPGAWSAREVVSHVADLEQDGWLPRVRWILEHGASRDLPGIDRERFRQRHAGVPLSDVLEEFRRARESNLASLDELVAAGTDLMAEGRHPTFGRVTLSQLLSTWVVHDLTHIAQIARCLAVQYGDAVGPWASFLSVLRERRSV